MAVEIGVACKLRPDPELMERLAGPVMSSALTGQLVVAWVEESNDVWTVNWGGAATAVVVLLPPGSHEFGEDWFAVISPGERGVDLSLLLAVAVASLTAIAYDGRMIDESAIVSSSPLSGQQILARILHDSERTASEVLTALRDRFC